MFQDVILSNVVLLLFVLAIALYFKGNLRPYAFIALALAFACQAISEASHQNFLALLWLVLAIASIIRYRFEKNSESNNDLGRALGASVHQRKK